MIALTLGDVAAAVGGRLEGGADPATRVTGFSTDSRARTRATCSSRSWASTSTRTTSPARPPRAVPWPRWHPAPSTCPRWSSTTTRCSPSAVSPAGSWTGCRISSSSGSPARRARRAPRTSWPRSLAELGPVVAPQGSFNTEVGLPLTALQVDERTRVLVSEMGARGLGHIAYLCTVTPPRIGVVLNVGSAHVGEFGSRENIAVTKGELVESVPPAADGGVAVLNADDDLVAAMAPRTRGAGGALRPSRPRPTSAPRTRRPSTTRGGRASPWWPRASASPVSLQLFGAHQVSNALAVAAAALEPWASPATPSPAASAVRPRRAGGAWRCRRRRPASPW